VRDEFSQRRGGDALAPEVSSDPVADQSLVGLLVAGDEAGQLAVDDDCLVERVRIGEDSRRPVGHEGIAVSRRERGHGRGDGIALVLEEDGQVAFFDVAQCDGWARRSAVRRLLGAASPIALQELVVAVVPPLSVLEGVVVARSAVLESELLDDSARRGVFIEAADGQLVQPERGECEVEHRMAGFHDQASALERGRDPVSELCAVHSPCAPLPGDFMQADDSAEVGFVPDRPRDSVALNQRLLGGLQERDGFGRISMRRPSHQPG
jgi:hypothetical protein